jgi:Immunity protein 10
MRAFEANAIAVSEQPELNTFAVLLAEQPDGGGLRLELQLALSFDDQDKQLGQDTYCVGTEDGRTHYGGVAGWSITNGLLTVCFDTAGAAALEVKGFQIRCPEDRVEALRDALSKILGPSRAS